MYSRDSDPMVGVIFPIVFIILLYFMFGGWLALAIRFYVSLKMFE